MKTLVMLAKSSTFTTNISLLPHFHGCIFQKCLSDAFVREVEQFLDIPPTPPQLRDLGIFQRLKDLNYTGEKNDESAIRRHLLERYTHTHLCCRIMAKEIVPAGRFEFKDHYQRFENLPALKQEITRLRAKLPKMAGIPMTRLFRESERVLIKIVEQNKLTAERRKWEREQEEKLKENPFDLLVKKIEEITIERKGESQKDDRETTLETLQMMIEDMKIDPEKRDVMDEAKRRFHEERNRRLAEQGLPLDPKSSFAKILSSKRNILFFYIL